MARGVLPISIQQTMTTLLNLPNEVLKPISENLDFRSILTLRKVCRDLRNFVDDVIPSSSIYEIAIRISTKRISLSFKDLNSEENFTEIKYKNHKKGCSTIKNVGNKKMKKRVGQKDSNSFESIFWKDVSNILKFQKKILDKLSIVFEHYEHKSDKENFEMFIKDLMEKFKEVLKTRPRPLKVKFMDYGIKNQMEMMTVLPYIDANVLEKIRISNSQGIGESPLIIYKIVELEQWKNAKEVAFNEFMISEDVKSFGHFSNVIINSMAILTTNTITSLKQIFQHSPTMNHFEIYYSPTDPQDLRTLFGHPFDGSYTDEDGGARWFFKISGNTEEVISIRSNLFTWFSLSRVKLSDLPESD